MRWIGPAVVCVALVSLLAVSALAEDIHPPWWRGLYSTTSQIWEFSEPQPNPILPDGPAPGGMPPLPSTHLMVQPGPPLWDHWMDVDQPWQDPSGGGTVGMGVWPLSGIMDILVDNHNPPNEVKFVWLQLTWRPQEPGMEAEPLLVYFDPAPVNPPTIIDQIQLGPEWWHTTYAWEIRPNPVDEYFVIEGNINIDEVVIDTWCIPEPGTMLLLSTGVIAGLGVIRRRRRR